MGPIPTTEEFIEKSNKIHNNYYTYFNCVYKKSSEKVCVTCPVHGDFWQTPCDHQKGRGCKKCGIISRSSGQRNTVSDLIEKFDKIHNGKYKYSEFKTTEYVNTSQKIPIECLTHGIFYQKVHSHMSGHGCPKCADQSRFVSRSTNKSRFIEKCKNIHNNKYTYINVPDNFSAKKTTIKILCPIHGIVTVKADNHMRGCGCKKCGTIKVVNGLRADKNNFIDQSNIIHNNKYSYENVNYVNDKTKVCITCPKHGDFYQVPYSHKAGHGCPACRSSKGEMIISKYLEENKIIFISEHRFKDCKGKRNSLPFDFYIPYLNMCIEFDGIQHFQPYENWGGMKALIYLQANDSIKTSYCKSNNIKLIRIKYTEIRKIKSILKSILSINAVSLTI